MDSQQDVVGRAPEVIPGELPREAPRGIESAQTAGAARSADEPDPEVFELPVAGPRASFRVFPGEDRFEDIFGKQ